MTTISTYAHIQMKIIGSLLTIAVVSLYEHDLLRDVDTLLFRYVAEHVSQARVCLFVTVCHTHAATSGNIESFQLAIFADNGDESNIVRKDVDVIIRRDSDCNFELGRNGLDTNRGEGRSGLPSEAGRTRHTGARRP